MGADYPQLPEATLNWPQLGLVSHRVAQMGLQELQAESPEAQVLVTFELSHALMSQRHLHVQVILSAAIPPVALVFALPPVATPPDPFRPPNSDTAVWVTPPDVAALVPSGVAPLPPVEFEFPPLSSSLDELHAKPTIQTRQRRCELN
jgi:hypothetical protein